MAEERCTPEIHEKDPKMKFYDWEYYKQLLPHIKGEVLDIGCGAGMFIKEYSKKDEVVSVIGIDKYIDEMPTDLPKVQSSKFVIPDELAVSDESAKFDTIVSTELLEHIERDKLEPLLEIIKGYLKPDGVFVGSTPNKVSPTTNPYHLYEYTLKELLGIFKNYFTDVEMWDDGQNCTLWRAKL